jgi:NAD(P)H dehydrogenase (quinone)
MHVLLILGHQRPGSFCHAIAQTAIDQLQAAGHDVIYHDLYVERFDPVLPHDEIDKEAVQTSIIQRHCDEVLRADGYIVVHPNWWGQPPAILKGWIDRVLRQGVAYEFGPAGGVIPHLAGKTAVVFTTSNTPRDAEMELFGDPLENLWKNCIFGFCGVRSFWRRNFEPIVLSTPQQRADWLGEARQLIQTWFP